MFSPEFTKYLLNYKKEEFEIEEQKEIPPSDGKNYIFDKLATITVNTQNQECK